MAIVVALAPADRATQSVPPSPGPLSSFISPFRTVREGRAAPNLQFVAMCDSRRTLRICHTREYELEDAPDTDELKGIALHDVEQYEARLFVAYGSRYEWADITDNKFHALVAIDAERTLTLVSLSPSVPTQMIFAADFRTQSSPLQPTQALRRCSSANCIPATAMLATKYPCRCSGRGSASVDMGCFCNLNT